MSHFAKLFFALLVFNLISCDKGFRTPELEAHFSKGEMADLSKIVDFFNQQLCQDQDKPQFESCFKNHLHLLLESTNNPLLQLIDFKEQEGLYNTISKSTFDAICLIKQRKTPDPEISYKTNNLNLDGPYFNFLKALGLKNNLVLEYTEYLRYAGGVENYGILESDIFRKKEGLNFKDPNMQLLIAVHYLTANDM